MRVFTQADVDRAEQELREAQEQTRETLRRLAESPRLYTEAEVCERERAAFFNGAVYGEMEGMVSGIDSLSFPKKAHDEAARRYPIPQKGAA